VRFVDEAAARIEHGGTLRVAACGPSAHIVRFAVDETRTWFPEVVPIDPLTADAEASEEDAVDLAESRLTPEDVVLAVSRSGSRSWICMLMRKANMLGALTASLSCLPDNPVSRESDMPIVVPSGPEVVMGCTQYRAGTVVKVLLDAVLLALAVRAGGLMGDVPVAADPGADAWRLVAAAGDVDPMRARSLLATAAGDVLAAIVMARLGLGADEARMKLAQAGRRLEKVLNEP
jgi:N-acetylmuramic acid 6-phosphate etherase